MKHTLMGSCHSEQQDKPWIISYKEKKVELPTPSTSPPITILLPEGHRRGPKGRQGEDGVGVLQRGLALRSVDVRHSSLCHSTVGTKPSGHSLCCLAFQSEILGFRPSSRCPKRTANNVFPGRASGGCK